MTKQSIRWHVLIAVAPVTASLRADSRCQGKCPGGRNLHLCLGGVEASTYARLEPVATV